MNAANSTPPRVFEHLPEVFRDLSSRAVAVDLRKILLAHPQGIAVHVYPPWSMKAARAALELVPAPERERITLVAGRPPRAVLPCSQLSSTRAGLRKR